MVKFSINKKDYTDKIQKCSQCESKDLIVTVRIGESNYYDGLIVDCCTCDYKEIIELKIKK